VAGFTFVGRESEISGFRALLARPEGELLLIAGPEGAGKSHLLRRLRREAEAAGSHFVQFNDLSSLSDADLRYYAIISTLAAGHNAQGEADGGGASAPELLPNPREFLSDLMTEDRRPSCDKLLRVFSAASSHLGDSARLVLLLDMGRSASDAASPIEFLARRLPDKIKVVVSAPEVPAGLDGLEHVTVIDGLPVLTEAEVGRLLEFHLPKGAVTPDLLSVVMKRYDGQVMAIDLAAKLAAGSDDPAETLGTLPTAPDALCSEMLGHLNADQRELVRCVARVPSGVDINCLRALTQFSDADLGRLLRTDAIRNIVITQRTERGPEARLFHELVADAMLADAPDDEPAAKTFHQLAAGFFLEAVQDDPTDVVAIGAHAHHLRLSGDKGQFIRDFPKTYKAKHSFRLFQQLADEYQLLIEYCDELGVTSINRPACLANLGRVYQELGHNESALNAHRQALDLYQEADDAVGTAEQFANIASVLQTLDQLDEAIEHLQKATALDEGTDNKAALAADLNNLGIVYQQLDRHDDALECHQRALKLHEQLDNDIGCANQLANMAAIHRARNDLHAARECYQKAWIIDTRTGNTLAQVVDLCNLGLIFQELGDMEKAIISYQQAVELDRVAADREAESSHLRTLAAMFLKLGKHHDEAIQALQQALDTDRSVGNAKGEAADLLALAKAYRAAGELTMARDLLERAASFSARLGDDDAQESAQRALENIDRELRGETVDNAKAETDRPPTQVIQRGHAGKDPWTNLQLAEDEPGSDICPPGDFGIEVAPDSEPHDAAAPSCDHTTEPHGTPVVATELALALETPIALATEGADPTPSREPAPEHHTTHTTLLPQAAPVCQTLDPGLAAEAHANVSTLADLASEVEDSLRRERDEALKRVEELEAELQTYKQLVGSLRSIVGQAVAEE